MPRKPQGAPATGVDVLLKVYAKCIDGQRDVANGRILEALSQ
ncbi:hypothetical protein [Nonomuraea indica]|nr:hypothetical protein [Nonomuraea indica]